MKKIYMVRRAREVEYWLIDEQWLEPIEAENLRDARRICEEKYGTVLNFRKVQKKRRPELAGVFSV